MSKQGYIKTEHKESFYARHQWKICGGIILVSAGVIAVPYIRQEIADYHLMLVKVAESQRLLEALAYNEGIEEVLA